MSSFLKKHELINALRNKEIPYFRAIVDCYLGKENGFITDFEKTIDELLALENTPFDQDDPKNQEIWNAFLQQKDKFYEIILDESFDKSATEIKKTEDGTEADKASDLERICRQTLRNIMQDCFDASGINENLEPYFIYLWNYLQKPCRDKGNVKRVMTFDRELNGTLLYSKIAFNQYSWLRDVEDHFQNLNKDIHIIYVDALSDAEKKSIEKEISEAEEKAKTKEIVLSSLYYVYYDILFEVLPLCNRKQFETWLVHDAAKSLSVKPLFSSAEMKRILACLTKDDEWQGSQKPVKFSNDDLWLVKKHGKTSIFLNPEILSWNDSAINHNADNAKENIDKLNQIIKEFIEKNVEKKMLFDNPFYSLFYKKKYDMHKNDGNLKKAFNKCLDDFSKKGPAIKNILLDRIEVNILKLYNDSHIQMAERINGYFQQNAERVKGICARYPDCHVCSCIREVPGLDAKAVDEISQSGGEE